MKVRKGLTVSMPLEPTLRKNFSCMSILILLSRLIFFMVKLNSLYYVINSLICMFLFRVNLPYWLRKMR